MSNTTITISVVALLFLSIGIIYVVQAREKARLNKMRKISQLQDRIRRYERLTVDLPPQYLSKELRGLLMERTVDCIQELISLQAGSQWKSELTRQRAALEEWRADKLKLPAIPIKTDAEAKNVRDLLEILFKFVEAQAKQGKLDKNSAQKQLQHINYLIAQSQADSLANRASEARNAGKLRAAIHNLHDAVGALSPVKSHPLAAKALLSYQHSIKEMTAAADEANQIADNTPPASDEWEKFTNQAQDDWKKKNAYDD